MPTRHFWMFNFLKMEDEKQNAREQIQKLVEKFDKKVDEALIDI